MMFLFLMSALFCRAELKSMKLNIVVCSALEIKGGKKTPKTRKTNVQKSAGLVMRSPELITLNISTLEVHILANQLVC